MLRQAKGDRRYRQDAFETFAWRSAPAELPLGRRGLVVEDAASGTPRRAVGLADDHSRLPRILRKGEHRVVADGRFLKQSHDASDAELAIAGKCLLAARPCLRDVVPPRVDRDPEAGRISADLVAARTDQGEGSLELIRLHPVKVQLICIACGEAPGPVWSVPPDDDRHMRSLKALRQIDRSSDSRVLARIG